MNNPLSSSGRQLGQSTRQLGQSTRQLGQSVRGRILPGAATASYVDLTPANLRLRLLQLRYAAAACKRRELHQRRSLSHDIALLATSVASSARSVALLHADRVKTAALMELLANDAALLAAMRDPKPLEELSAPVCKVSEAFKMGERKCEVAGSVLDAADVDKEHVEEVKSIGDAVGKLADEIRRTQMLLDVPEESEESLEEMRKKVEDKRRMYEFLELSSRK